MQCLQKPEEGVGPSRTSVTDACEHGVGTGILWEQPNIFPYFPMVLSPSTVEYKGYEGLCGTVRDSKSDCSETWMKCSFK